MPVVNICDRRKRRYRFEKVNAIIEAAWHSNTLDDADQVREHLGPSYDEREHVSIAEAITWAHSGDYAGVPVTLFLYDADGGIYPHVEEGEPEDGR